MKDPYSHVQPVATLAIATRSAATTVNGATVDRLGGGKMFQAALAVIHAGTIDDGTHTFELQHSDNGSSWEAVPDADLQGSEPALQAADSGEVHVIGYRGRKRYLRVSVTTAGATDGGTFGAMIVLADPRVAPVS